MDVLASPVVVSTLPPLAVPAAPLAAAPDALATARFSALMQAPPATVTPAAQAAAAAASNPAEPHSVGDRILAGMQSVSGEFQSPGNPYRRRWTPMPKPWACRTCSNCRCT